MTLAAPTLKLLDTKAGHIYLEPLHIQESNRWRLAGMISNNTTTGIKLRRLVDHNVANFQLRSCREGPFGHGQPIVTITNFRRPRAWFEELLLLRNQLRDDENHAKPDVPSTLKSGSGSRPCIFLARSSKEPVAPISNARCCWLRTQDVRPRIEDVRMGQVTSVATRDHCLI